jgi:hypothetical protein
MTPDNTPTDGSAMQDANCRWTDPLRWTTEGPTRRSQVWASPKSDMRRNSAGRWSSYTGHSFNELSKEYGCTSWSIRMWVKQADRDRGRGDGGLTSVEREELSRLRRESLKLDPRARPGR